MALTRFARDSGGTIDRAFWIPIALLPTDALFNNFASNHYKSPIGLATNKADRLTNHL